MRMRGVAVVAASCGLGFQAGAVAPPPPAPVLPVPTSQQLAWQRLELTMFLHFGVNTFTDREWGDGKEAETLFNPSALDARQWARMAREAGFKLLILTAKHHDGFCLWPSAQTTHSVQQSPWLAGKGDVVRLFTDACRAEGLKIGLYLSPWDRNQAVYGDSPAYNDYFCKQLTELLSQYGVVDEVWFDGACGEGPNGKRQEYDWARYYRTIYERNPRAVVAICGPDVRWVGNESGVARVGESSVQAARHGRQTATGGKVWYPAECDVSIRPGWFYHGAEDGRVKALEQLLDIYFKSVGRNSVLLLNVPPDRRGLIADADVARLREFRAVLDQTFVTNLAAGARLTAEAVRGADPRSYGPARLLDGDPDTYWATDDGVTQACVTVDLGAARTFNVVRVQEAIALGERVQAYRVEARVGDRWQTLARGTVIGHKNLLKVPRTTAAQVRLVVERAQGCPALAELGLHLCPLDAGWATGAATAHKPAKASNVHPGGTCFGADKAVDDDGETRWATSDDTRACWLEVDLLAPTQLGRLVIRELEPRIARFELQARDAEAADWQTIHQGGKAGKAFETGFPPVTARYVRLNILEATFAPTIWEFQVLPPK